MMGTGKPQHSGSEWERKKTPRKGKGVRKLRTLCKSPQIEDQGMGGNRSKSTLEVSAFFFLCPILGME